MAASAYVLVEGSDDQHVVWALCGRHKLPKVFSVQTPKTETENVEGIDAILASLPIRLKAENLQVLGIVVDANTNLAGRWQALRSRLLSGGYQNLPDPPATDGLVLSQANLPRVGVWLMPDNQLPGMLEDFAAQLIPPGDALWARANAVVEEIEAAGLNRYIPAHRSKALIHTWLAWQERPGMPMGQAITARVLGHDSPIALAFIAWLKRLFDLPAAPAA